MRGYLVVVPHQQIRQHPHQEVRPQDYRRDEQDVLGHGLAGLAGGRIWPGTVFRDFRRVPAFCVHCFAFLVRQPSPGFARSCTFCLRGFRVTLKDADSESIKPHEAGQASPALVPFAVRVFRVNPKITQSEKYKPPRSGVPAARAPTGIEQKAYHAHVPPTRSAGQVCNYWPDNMLQAAFGIDFGMTLNTNDIVNAILHLTVNA